MGTVELQVFPEIQEWMVKRERLGQLGVMDLTVTQDYLVNLDHRYYNEIIMPAIPLLWLCTG